jgi:hypothetical protein
MTDDQIKEYLKHRGCPETVWSGGRERLIQHWKNFVAEVQQGYCPKCMIEEYWNDLDTRELIHDIGRDNEVKDVDENFAAMLTAREIKHWHKDRKADYDFWNYGYPKNASGYFLQDVKRHFLTLGTAEKPDVRLSN